MDKPQVFNHQTFGDLPVIVVDEVEWFGATEAAKALGFSNPHAAIQNHVDEDDLTVHEVTDSLGRAQQKNFTNESGLYSLIFGSAKQGNNPDIQAKARGFKRWVTSEVLPSIRKTGSYGMPQLSPAEVLAGVANQLVEQERRLAAMEAATDQLTHGLTAVPDHTKVVDRVNEYARWTRLGHNEVYNKVYDILQSRHGIDVRQRVENERHRINIEHFNSTGRYYAEATLKKKINGIDVMVRMGVLDKFNEILVGLLANAKGASVR